MTMLILGAEGQVGSEICCAAHQKNFLFSSFNRETLDITDAEKIKQVFDEVKPSVVINAAAYTAVDKAETEIEKAYAVNYEGPKNLSIACAAQDIPLIHLSTDYVFNGKKTSAYDEKDAADPVGVYAKSKWMGEQAVREFAEKHIILRVSWVFGAKGNNFVKTILRLANEREELKIVADQYGCPTYAGDIADAILQTIEKIKKAAPWGTYHYVGKSSTTWFHFAEHIVSLAKQKKHLTVKKILPITTAEYPTLAQRPANSELNCKKMFDVFSIQQRDWMLGLEKMMTELL